MGKIDQDGADKLPVSLVWQALTKMDRDYTGFIHLLDSEGKLWSQLDSQPLGGTHPTSEWTEGEIVIDKLALPLAPDLPSGNYRLVVGWYELASMERLPAFGEDSLYDKVDLGIVEIP